MFPMRLAVILVLSAAASTRAVQHFLQSNKEYIYNYKGFIAAQTELPEEYGSEFLIHGKLHLQASNNLVKFSFQNLKYKMSNGKSGKVFNGKDVRISKDAADLYKPFYVLYDDDGKVDGYYKPEGEKKFSLNIKKSVASIFQITKKALEGKMRSFGLFDFERTIRGERKVNYDVKTEKNSTMITKFEEINPMSNVLDTMITNTEMRLCQSPEEDLLTYDNQKQYNLIKSGRSHLITKVVATGGVYLQPFRAKSEAHYIYTNVTLDLKEVKLNSKMVQVSGLKFTKGLQYEYFDSSKDSSGFFPDTHQGRRNLNMEDIKKRVIKKLGAISEYLQGYHLDASPQDASNGQVINEIQSELAQLDYQTIKKLYDDLNIKYKHDEEGILNILQKLLPLVGTTGCGFQVLDLIINKRIEDSKAVGILQELALNLKHSNKNFVKKMEKLAEMDPYTEIGKAGILTFGTIIYKSCKLFKCDKNFNDKYFDWFKFKIENASSKKARLIYLQGLHNAKFDKNEKYFWELLIKDVREDSIHLTALWAIFPLIREDPTKIFELYFPMFTDSTLPTHQRILAFYLMMESNLPLRKMWKIHWYVQNDANHEIYQFYYKYLSSLADSENACKSSQKDVAKTMLRYTHPPGYYGVTGYYSLDYHDKKFGFGNSVGAFLVVDKNTALIKVAIQNNFFNRPFNPLKLWMKIQGLQGLEKLALKTVDQNSQFFNFDEVLEALLAAKKTNRCYIEIILFQQDKVFNSFYFDNIALPELELMSIVKQYQKTQLDIAYKMNTQAFLASDLGFPILLEWLIPSVTYRNVKVTRRTEPTSLEYSVDFALKNWMHSRSGLSFYNSVADIWQGIARYRSFDSAVPVYVNVSFAQDSSVTFKFDKHSDGKKSTGGYGNHITSVTFVKDDSKTRALTLSSPNAQEIAMVTKGDGYRHNYPTGQLYFGTFGYDYSLTVFDSERKITNASMKNPDYWFSYPKSQSWNPSLANLYRTYMQKWNRILYQPFPSTFGVVEKWEPSIMYPTTHQFTFSHDYQFLPNKETPYLPGIVYKANVTTVDYYGKEPQSTTEFLVKYTINLGHTIQVVEIQSESHSSIVPPSKRLCIVGAQRWEENEMKGYLSFSQNYADRNQGCTQEGQIIVMTMSGVKSVEQHSDRAVYGDCDYIPSPNGVRHKQLPCYVAYDTFRNYTFDIDVVEEPDVIIEKISYYIWDKIKASLYGNYKFVDRPSENVKEGRMKVVLTYPLEGVSYNIKLLTPYHEYQFNELENMWISKIFGLKTSHFSTMYKFLHNVGLTNYCSLYNHTINYKYDAEAFTLPSKWTLLAGDNKNNPSHGVFAKQIQETNHMALQLLHEDHNLTIVPTALYHYDVQLDGEKLDLEYHSNEWFYYRQVPYTDFVSIIYYHFGAHLYYDGAHVHVDIPKMDVPYYGKCYRNI